MSSNARNIRRQPRCQGRFKSNGIAAVPLRQLRFHLLAQQPRITYWLAPGRRIILLTVFRTTRNAEVPR